MTKKLPTIEEFNKERAKHYSLQEHNGAGVACPVCGKEMVFVNSLIISTWPPRRTVTCPAGHFQSTVIA